MEFLKKCNDGILTLCSLSEQTPSRYPTVTNVKIQKFVVTCKGELEIFKIKMCEAWMILIE